EAETLSRETWLGRQELLGAEHRDTLNSLATYQSALLDQRKLQEAEKLARLGLEISERVFGPDDNDTIVALGNLAYVLGTRGNLVECERYLRETARRYQHAGHADKLD